MDRWQVLFGQAAAAVALERRRAEWHRVLGSDARALAKWSSDAASELMSTIRARASERVEMLAGETELSVLVIGPDWSTVGGALVGVVRLIGPDQRSTLPGENKQTVALAGDEVQIYVHLAAGHLPTIQFMVPGDSGWVKRSRHIRWLTLPCARLGWAHDGRPVLIGTGPNQPRLLPDDVVYRAFELLLRRMIQRAAPRDLRPATCPPSSLESISQP